MDASPVWLIPATFPVAKTLPALRSLPPSHVKKRPRLMVARYSLAGWPGVRPPNGPVFDGGIALFSPTEWRHARPRDCTVFGHRRNGDFCDAQTHVQPRAAGVSPPWLGHTIAVSGEANAVQRRANTRPEATFVSPPWFRKRTFRYASAKSRETAIGALTNAGAVAVVNPRGAYTLRSCVGVRISAGEKTIFAMHKSIFAGAAGVSPPWLGDRTSCG
jgi:hypothetical protein